MFCLKKTKFIEKRYTSLKFNLIYNFLLKIIFTDQIEMYKNIFVFNFVKNVIFLLKK